MMPSGLRIRLVGQKSNREGIGAVIKLVVASGKEQHATVSTAGSYLSASDRRVHFGLVATEHSAKYLEIRWPSDVAQRVENVMAKQILQLPSRKLRRASPDVVRKKRHCVQWPVLGAGPVDSRTTKCVSTLYSSPSFDSP